jgi:hypothetical protein
MKLLMNGEKIENAYTVGRFGVSWCPLVFIGLGYRNEHVISKITWGIQ